MSTSLHMELPVLWEQIRALRRCAWDMTLWLQDVGRLLRLLEEAWQGGSADTFQIRGQHLLREFELLVQELDYLARLLHQETTKWQQIDLQGARRLAQLGTTSKGKEG